MIQLDKEGFLRNLDDWSEEVAMELATAEHIELTDTHWQLIHLVRGFYRKFHVSPEMRPLVKLTRDNLGITTNTSIHLMRLFPGSPAKLVAKIAGLPRPKNCL